MRETENPDVAKALMFCAIAEFFKVATEVLRPIKELSEREVAAYLNARRGVKPRP